MDLIGLFEAVPPPVVYAAVGALVGVESLGIPVPGETALITATLLATQDRLALSPVGIGISGIVAAIVGDSIGYLVGRRWGDRVLAQAQRRLPRQVTAQRLDFARSIFTEYGARAVFFGRFIALLRMLSGPLSGALGLPYRRFLLGNALGAIAWAGGIVAVVWVFGQAAQRWLGAGAWVALLVFLVAGYVLAKVAERGLDRRIDARVESNAGSPGASGSASGTNPDGTSPR